MRSAQGAKGQPAPARIVLVKLVWKDASGFLSLLNASRESAVTARTAKPCTVSILPQPPVGFKTFACLRTCRTRPPTLSSYSGRALDRVPPPPHPPPEPIDMYDNQCRDLLMGSQR